MDLARGSAVGPYEVCAKLSDGGMSTLYSAKVRGKYRRQGGRQRVVLKVANWDREVFLKEEAEFLARFRHPGIVRICPLPTTGGDDFVGFVRTADGRQPYIALEYASGGSLEERLARYGPLPVRQAVSIALQVGRALDHVHGRSVVNRDVKPGNIVFRRRPGLLQPDQAHVVLCDFGIAQDLTRPHAGEGRVGTFAYMSPEQVQRVSQDWIRIGPESDIFGLGVVLYEMLTGRTPFDDDMARIADPAVRPAPPSSLRKGIPPLLDKIVLQALEKDPCRRFRTAGELIQALERVPRQVNWAFVMGRAAVLSLFVLVMILAWQVGSVIRDGGVIDVAPIATERAGPQPTFTAVIAPASPRPASTPGATSLSGVEADPSVTPREPTSTPIYPTATPPPP